jgi:hypothetical protein
MTSYDQRFVYRQSSIYSLLWLERPKQWACRSHFKATLVGSLFPCQYFQVAEELDLLREFSDAYSDAPVLISVFIQLFFLVFADRHCYLQHGDYGNAWNDLVSPVLHAQVLRF